MGKPSDSVEYPVWYAILDFREKGTPISAKAVEDIADLIKRLRQKAEISEGERKQHHKVREDRAGWVARYQQLKHENNKLRAANNVLNKRVRELTGNSSGE